MQTIKIRLPRIQIIETELVITNVQFRKLEENYSGETAEKLVQESMKNVEIENRINLKVEFRKILKSFLPETEREEAISQLLALITPVVETTWQWDCNDAYANFYDSEGERLGHYEHDLPPVIL
jgi:hypothetical protein